MFAPERDPARLYIALAFACAFCGGAAGGALAVLLAGCRP